MTGRPWPWLRDLIFGLLTRPVTLDAHGQTVFANRLQEALYAPPAAGHSVSVSREG